MFTTTVDDAQGAFILHPAMTANGVEPGVPAFVTISSAAQPIMDQVFSEMPALTDSAAPPLRARTSAASFGQNAPAYANFAEQVFGELAQAGNVTQETTFAQPGPLWNSDLGDLAMADAHSLLLPAQQPGAVQTNWLSDDYPGLPAAVAQTRRGNEHAGRFGAG